MIILPYRAAQGVLQVLGRIEAGGGQHFANPCVEALDPVVRLGMTGLDQPGGNAVGIAGAIKAMTPGAIAFAGGATAIGALLPLIGRDVLHPAGRFRDESLAKGAAGGVVFSSNMATPPRGARSMPTNRSQGRKDATIAEPLAPPGRRTGGPSPAGPLP